jgi:hypothetical protein
MLMRMRLSDRNRCQRPPLWKRHANLARHCHATAPEVAPRFMAQPPLMPHEPLWLCRSAGDYSPVEQAILNAIVNPTAYPDGSLCTLDGKFASASGAAAPRTASASPFVGFLIENGVDVLWAKNWRLTAPTCPAQPRP